MKSTSKASTPDLSKKQAFAFTRENYKWVLIGLAFIVVGFILMIGGGSDNPDVFSDKIFNFQRWTLAPMLVLAGYAIEIYAIMKKPKE
ncbi:MAG: DUF3098 domain-containing protein [Bacteroidetes bacterium]|jgi:hypothetical protein|nr:DUF3098 domain-containing protein [Bacteroidota bacterium]